MRSKSVSALASLLRPRRLAASSHSHRGRYVIPHERVWPAAAPTCCSGGGAAVHQTCTPGVLLRARRNRPQSCTRSVPLRKRCRRPTKCPTKCTRSVLLRKRCRRPTRSVPGPLREARPGLTGQGRPLPRVARLRPTLLPRSGRAVMRGPTVCSREAPPESDALRPW